jgi:hypothetical protein
MPYIVPIVGGESEVAALPALLYRIASRAGAQSSLRIAQPIKVYESKFFNDAAYFDNWLQVTAYKATKQNGVVLVLFDCEDDCPAVLGPELLRRAKAVRPDVNIIITLAYREFETWFLSTARSLRGHGGLPDALEPPPNPESRRGAKEWLSKQMGKKYVEVTHQLEFTRAFDLEQAKDNPSFARFYQRIQDLLAHAL